MATYADVVERAKRRIRQVSGTEAEARLGQALFIDCRELLRIAGGYPARPTSPGESSKAMWATLL